MYETTEEYQALLLTFFGCKEEELVSTIESYYHSLENEELKQLCQLIHEQTNIPLEMSFYILFSYDYFQDMQLYLKDKAYYPTFYKKIKS